MKKIIGYVIIREDLDHPIINSQVIDVITSIKVKEIKVVLIWFYRLDAVFRKDLKSIKKILENKNIEFFFLPFISGRFPLKILGMLSVIPQWIVGMFYVIVFKKITIFHCRSYNSSLICMLMKYLFKIEYIFDPRSPYIEENCTIGALKYKSFNYNLWKKIEFLIIKKCKNVILPSKTFVKIYGLDNFGKYVIIPNNYPLSFDENTYDINQDSNIIKLCYIGSLGNWNNIEIYCEFINNLKKILDFKIIFLVNESSVNYLKKKLKDLVKDPIYRVESVEQKLIPTKIKGCCCGLQLMKNEDVRLSIKCVEYIALGLPVIASKNVQGACEVIKDHNVGIIIDNTFESMEIISNWIKKVHENKDQISNSCKKIALLNFSTAKNASKLTQLYSNFR